MLLYFGTWRKSKGVNGWMRVLNDRWIFFFIIFVVQIFVYYILYDYCESKYTFQEVTIPNKYLLFFLPFTFLPNFES